MRALSLLVLSFSLASLPSHAAQAVLPTLCTAAEKPLISGETPRGFASLCAGQNNVWHYRFGEPSHITYVFPRDNSPATKNFSGDVLDYQRDQGGSIFAFQDHGRDIYLFDARTTVWGDQRNIIGKMAGIRIKDPKRHKAIDIPFTRLTPGGETSWTINQKPPFASAVTEQMGEGLNNQEGYIFYDGYSDSTTHLMYYFDPSIAEEYPYDPSYQVYFSYTPFFPYNAYDEFEKTFLIFTQKSAVPITNWPLASYNPPTRAAKPSSLCSPTEKIIISGRTSRGNFASLCADGIYWQYRFGKPGHLTDQYPKDHRPAREVFDYTRLPTFRKGDMMISGDIRFRFKKNDATFSLFSATEQRANDDGDDEGLHSNDDQMMSTHGGIVIQRPHERPSYILFNNVDYDAGYFVASPKTDPHIPPLPPSISAQEPRDVTRSAPFSIPSLFLDP